MKDFFDSIKKRDPAARNVLQILLLYPGVQAVIWYRVANFLYRCGLKLIAEMISYVVRTVLNIEIHPAATIGKRLFIDHGTGVVIGATAIIGDDVTIFHGVTLGGTSTRTSSGRRHPAVENSVLIGTGAKILGAITIGEGSRIGANAVVLQDIPPYTTAVGVPSVVKKEITDCYFADYI
ncbi:MAG: serine O-acetyltransferase [Defluviitaleaceae bacterium]|nr:serine O-acetyltransferase [Defluviitaleaceae bacterium]